MSERTPVLLMNVDGTLYPVGMTQDQTDMLRLFITGLSQEKPLSVLTKAPVIDAHEVVQKVEKHYSVNIVK
jgi:hypothetical protein